MYRLSGKARNTVNKFFLEIGSVIWSEKRSPKSPFLLRNVKGLQTTLLNCVVWTNAPILTQELDRENESCNTDHRVSILLYAVFKKLAWLKVVHISKT
jgi:hypothetical protein